MKALISIVGILFLVIVGVTTTVVVDETEHVVVTQFDRPVAIHSDAGLHWKAPAPLQRVTRFDKRILFSPGAEIELLTADKKNVLLSTYLSWQIADPLKYLVTLRTRAFAEARLEAIVQSELGSALGDLPFKALVPAESGGNELVQLEERVYNASARVAASNFGIEVVSFGITRLSFPSQNLKSVFARMRAERERMRVATVPRAKRRRKRSVRKPTASGRTYLPLPRPRRRACAVRARLRRRARTLKPLKTTRSSIPSSARSRATKRS